MKYFLLAAMTVAAMAACAQPSPPVLKNSSWQSAMNEVVQQYFENFTYSKGEIVLETPGVITYESRVTLPGALTATINQYALPDTYSWQADVDTSEFFESAAQKYRQYFRLLHGMQLAPKGYEKVQLTGRYDTPDEGRAFAASLFRLQSEKDGRANFVIELGMQYEFPLWIIRISMYEKLPDDKIRPGMRSLR